MGSPQKHTLCSLAANKIILFSISLSLLPVAYHYSKTISLSVSLSVFLPPQPAIPNTFGTYNNVVDLRRKHVDAYYEMWDLLTDKGQYCRHCPHFACDLFACSTFLSYGVKPPVYPCMELCDFFVQVHNFWPLSASHFVHLLLS